jgi:hypothetical protein
VLAWAAFRRTGSFISVGNFVDFLRFCFVIDGFMLRPVLLPVLEACFALFSLKAAVSHRTVLPDFSNRFLP